MSVMKWILIVGALCSSAMWNTASAQTAISFSFSGAGSAGAGSFTLNGSGSVTPYGPTTISVNGGPSGQGNLSIAFLVTFGDGSTWSATSIVSSSSQTSISGTATITSGTGTFAGATGSFNYVANGSFTSANFNFTVTGSGTVTISTSHLVVPGAWTGTAGTSEPLPILTNSTLRDQELIGPEQFGSGTALLITKIGYRAFPGSGPLSASATSLVVHLSTSPLFPNTDNGRVQMSTTYANNIGTDNTLVYSGPATLSSPGCAGPSPCPFDQVLTLTTPFLYNPTLGSLLVDVQYTGYTATAGSLDGALFPLPPGGAVAHVSGVSGTTGTFSPVGHVLQITYTGCSYFLSSGGQSIPELGGTATVNITAPAGCAWTISGVPSWITPSALSGTGSTTVTFQMGFNMGMDQFNTITVAGLSFNVAQQGALKNNFFSLTGSMPHIAAVENWTTTFTLVNKGTTAATTMLDLFGDAADPTGNGPLNLTLTFPQLPITANRLDTSSVDDAIAPNASWIASTQVKPASTSLVGTAQVLSTGNVDGFAIFHLIPSAQEAVVPLETRNASSYVMAFDNTNGVVLAVAIANVTAQPATVGIVIRDETGAIIGTPGTSFNLSANGHLAFVTSTSLPATANIRGTIEFDTPSGGQISVLGIRTTPLGTSTTITTVPPLANVGTGGGPFAYVAEGGDGWQTTFVLVNTGANSASAMLSFLNAGGNPMAIPVSFPPSGTSTLASSVTRTLAAGASLTLLTSGSTSLTLGSAQLTTTGNVSGFAIFRYNPTGQEAVVPLESRNASAYILAFNNMNGIATGLSISNRTAGTQPVIVPVTVRDDSGNLLAQHTIPMSPNGEFLGNLGPNLYPETANIRGTIEFDAPADAQIAVLGVRTPPTSTYTTLPPLAK